MRRPCKRILGLYDLVIETRISLRIRCAFEHTYLFFLKSRASVIDTFNNIRISQKPLQINFQGVVRFGVEQNRSHRSWINRRETIRSCSTATDEQTLTVSFALAVPSVTKNIFLK